jgi:AcrR family transcriptional regulator
MRKAKNDKRERLVQAADKLIYEQTFHTTTLADIAKEADVPLGNVYYYFKTKEAIMEAVLQQRGAQWRERFNHWEQIPDVKQRLQALIADSVEQSDVVANFGCVMGSLCQELGKQGGTLATDAAKLMTEIVQWTQAQFQSLGKEETQSLNLAQDLIASLQGISLLTLTFKEPNYIKQQSTWLNEWLSTV